ncbi:DUF4861 domain-containing protein [bacterium]|nr:DUF4861 domain-containing protein [bacterium]
MKTQTKQFLIVPAVITVFLFLHGICDNACAQQDTEKPIAFAKKLDIAISNPLDMNRPAEPVILALDDVLKKAPDFNRAFYRVKHPAGLFEPLDIPSQTAVLPGNPGREGIVFLVDLGPRERKTVELWYNPSGSDTTGYPARTQSFARWYWIENNVAWENEVIAYRSYGGIVDFFAKTYPHLRLHDIPQASYHHEQFWGLDPYLVGAKPGLGGLVMINGAVSDTLYDARENSPLTFVHNATGKGTVCTMATVAVRHNNVKKCEAYYVLYAGRHENDVTLVVSSGSGELPDNVFIAPGMEKIDGGRFIKDEKSGYFLTYGMPVGEYGTIGTAFIWNPADARGIAETGDGYFLKLKPDSRGIARYRSVAVWYRNSASQPSSFAALEEYVRGLARSYNNPVVVSVR